MQNQIDFTKPLEVVDMQGNIADNCKVIQVIPWSYFNDAFQHAVVVTAGTSIDLHAVTNDGTFESKRDSYFHEMYKLQNVKPKVTSETWVNLYTDGCAGYYNPNKKEADNSKSLNCKRYAYFVTMEYSDGTFTNEIIPISE